MNNIKAMRKKLHMTQIELADLCNISQSALSGYETGKYEPDNTTLRRLADIFHVSIDEILGYGGAAPQAAQLERQSILDNENSDSIRVPRTTEARILSAGVDKMPARDRERVLNMVKLMFDQYEEYFNEGTDDDDPES